MRFRRSLMLFAVVVLLFAAGCGLWVWHAKRQYARNRQLIAALMKDDANQALFLVNAGADPNTHFQPPPAPSFQMLLRQILHHKLPPGDDGPTAFLFACGAGCDVTVAHCVGWQQRPADVLVVQAMLTHGADIHEKPEDIQTPLVAAVLTNRLEVAKMLLEHGVNINEYDEEGMTPLMHAVEYHHPHLVHLLLTHGAEVNAQDKEADTALHLAVSIGIDTNSIRQLLAHGANANYKNKEGDTPIMLALQQKRPDIVALLKRGGK